MRADTFGARGTPPQDAQKVRPARPQAKPEPEAYPLGYVEDSGELRTKLADFFSILLSAAVFEGR